MPAMFLSFSEDRVVGVYAGASINTYLITQILRNKEVIERVGAYQIMLGNDKDFLCTRVSYKLDLRGPSMTIQTACSTSLVAVEVACRALNRHECDMALAGGVSINFPQRSGYLYEEGMIFSPDGHCRPFDEQARGTRAGSGAGIVVLKRLDDALADCDTIHAIILSAAINNDGSGKAGYTAPSVDGQIEVIAMAQALAGVNPRTISFMETHGTATPLGDPIEIAALKEVFRASTSDVGFCHLGALKANLGHLDAAAGVAGLIKAVLALKHREIPPLVNFQRANRELELETSPFVASAQRRPWPTDGVPRRAGVSSFGIGGTNAHVVLEEAPAASPGTSPRTSHLIILSAKTASALEQRSSRLASHLKVTGASLTDVEWTLQSGRKHFAHRRIIVASDAAQAATMLREPPGSPSLIAVHDGGVRPVAFLFSGQGSQHAGMGAGLYRTEPVYREAVDQCAERLAPHLGLDIRGPIFGEREDELNETRLAQPALFVTEYALAQLWMSWGIVPQAMLGHSIGEYVAAHLAGVFSLEDALASVALRGRLMQALPPGSMAAVHLSAKDLQPWLDCSIEIAAVNAPELSVVSGPAAQIKALLRRLAAAGVECRALHTSHAFHSRMMEPALAPIAAHFEAIALSPPTIPYVSNVTGDWIKAEEATSPVYYARHLRQAVLFETGVRTLAADPALLFLEVGPGNALASLSRMTLGRERQKYVVPSLAHPGERTADGERILEAAGRLWLAGAVLDWRSMHAGAAPRRVPLPTYPFERQRFWVEAALEARSDSGRDPVHSNGTARFYAPSWTREDEVAGREVSLDGTWLVLGDASALAAAVVTRLADVGAAPIFVEWGISFRRISSAHFSLRHDTAEDLAALVSQVSEPGRPIKGAIVLDNIGAGNSFTDAETTSRYVRLVALAQALATAGVSPVHVVVATAGVASVLDEPVATPAAALALGPVLVLPGEVPGLRMRCVDLERRGAAIDSDEASKALVEEAASMDREAFVARRARRRWVQRFERLDLGSATMPPQLRSRGVYLITGGLGGIGLELAKWLATAVSARLVLTQRTALPERGDWDRWLEECDDADRIAVAIRAIRQIEAAGGEVMVAAANASDVPAMSRAIDEAHRRWGALHGVIHAAGIPGTGTIAFRKGRDELRAVLEPKLGGLSALMQLLGDVPLDFVALMSSINAVLGAPGLCDYAAANAVLDAFVESAQRPAPWRQVLAIDWSAWRDIGMAARQTVPEARRAKWEAYLASALSPQVGVDAFARALASGRSRLIVSSFDLTEAIEHAAGSAAAIQADELTLPSPSLASDRPDSASPFEAPGSEMERRLVATWTELLGVERIGIHDNFFELGGHSLLATRILARVTEMAGVRLALRDVFEAPTVRLLAERIASLGRDATPAPTEDDREEVMF